MIDYPGCKLTEDGQRRLFDPAELSDMGLGRMSRMNKRDQHCRVGSQATTDEHSRRKGRVGWASSVAKCY